MTRAANSVTRVFYETPVLHENRVAGEIQVHGETRPLNQGRAEHETQAARLGNAPKIDSGRGSAGDPGLNPINHGGDRATVLRQEAPRTMSRVEDTPPGDDRTGPQAMRDLAGLWVRAQPAVSAFISANVADSHHVEDLVQEVAQIAAEKYGEFDSSRSFTSWTLGIARRRILKYYRTRSRDRLVLSEAALGRLAEALEEIDAQSESRREALRDCMERVDGRRRSVMDLRYQEGLRVDEIAGRMATSASAISVMLFRLRKSLLDCIQRRLSGSEAKP